LAINVDPSSSDSRYTRFVETLALTSSTSTSDLESP
jgi:hypothetical protein